MSGEACLLICCSLDLYVTANKVYMILLISIYAFLIVIGLFILSSPNEIIFFHIKKNFIISDIDIAVSLLSFIPPLPA